MKIPHYEYEVTDAIKRLPKGKAVGYDQLPAELGH